MHERRRHRRATTSNSHSSLRTSTSTIFTSSVATPILSNSRSFLPSNGSSVDQGNPTSTPNTSDPPVTLSTTSSTTPDTSSPSQSFTSQDSSTSLTTVSPSTTSTSTVYVSTAITVVNSQTSEVGPSPTPLASSTIPPLILTSRDGIIIISLSTLAGVLSLLCAFILCRHFRRRNSHQGLEHHVDPISFYQSRTPVSRRRNRGNTGSLTHFANVSRRDTASPQGIKRILRERDTPSYRFSHESDSALSPPNTPTQNHPRCSPAPDIYDSRWPGRLLLPMQSHRVSGITLDNSHVVDISGDISHQSDQSDAGSGSQQDRVATIPSNLPLSGVGSDNGQQALGGTTPMAAADVPPTKSELENSARRREAGQTGGGTWDGPPPEESEKAESAKTGPPAYSPNFDMQSIPPLPVPLPFPSGGVRPLPVPGSSSGTAGRSGSVRRLRHR